MANMPDEKNPFRKEKSDFNGDDFGSDFDAGHRQKTPFLGKEFFASLFRFLTAFLPKDQSGLSMIRLVSALLIGVFLPFTFYFNVYTQEGRANPFSKEIPLLSWWISWQPHDALQNMPVVPAGKNGALIYRPKNMSWIFDQDRVRQVYAPEIQNAQQKSAQAAIPQQQQGPDIRPQSGNEQRSAIFGAYCLPDGLRCWVVGDEGMVQTTVNGGDSWIGQVSNTRNNLNSIYVSPDETNGEALLVGERSTVLISRNLGRNWGRGEAGFSIRSEENFIAAFGALRGRYDLALSQRGVLASERLNHYALPEGTKGLSLTSAALSTDRKIIAGSTDGYIYRADFAPSGWTNNSSLKWQQGAKIATRAITSLYFQQDGQIGWAVEQPENPDQQKPIIHQTVDGGKSWEILSYRHLPPPVFLFAIVPTVLLAFFTLLLSQYMLVRMSGSQTGIEGMGTSDDPIGWQDKDHLQIKPLARSISRFLRNDKTIPPLTIAITGEWGKGKSSLMNLIAEDLKRYDAHPVWFNAWHHQKEEHLLAALLENIRNQAFPGWWRFSGLLLRMRLFLTRSLTDLKSLLAVLFLMVALWALTELAEGRDFTLENFILLFEKFKTLDLSEKALASLGVGGGGLSVLYLLLRTARKWQVVSFKPANLMASVSKRAGIAQFKEQLGFRYHFKSEFSDICHAMRKTSRTGMVIMIDDLDRCRPESVLEVLEAVNFLVTAGPCFIFLGIDEPKVRDAVAYGFKDSVLKLDNVQAGATKVEVDAKSLAEFADNYLKKLINIPVAVPTLTEEGSREIGSSLPDEEVHLSPWPDRFRSAWRNIVDVGIALVIFLALGFGGSELVKSYAVTEEANQSGEATNPPANGDASNAVQQGQAQGPQGNTRQPETNASAVNLPSVAKEDLQDKGFQFLEEVGVLLIALLLFIVIRRSSKEQDEKIEDTARFKDALSIWNPAVFASNPTPRDMKRYHNRLRFNAMRLRPFNAKLTWLDKLFKVKLKKDVDDIDIPEPTLVALGAVESFAPDLITGKEAAENYNPADFNTAVQNELKKMNGSIPVKTNGSAVPGDGTEILKDFKEHYPDFWPPKKEYFDEYQQLNKALD